jgi:hypothetical protein
MVMAYSLIVRASNKESAVKRTRLYIIVFFALISLYLLIALLLPPDPAAAARYHLSLLQIRILSLSIVVPILAIWSALFYGFITIKRYVELIQHNTDGKALLDITKGLQWLTFGLPALAIINSLMNYYARVHTDFKPASVIIQNYQSLILYLISFVFISRGAYSLSRYVQKKSNPGEQRVWVLLHIVLSVVYTYLILNRPIHAAGQRQVYYLPNLIIITTLAIPYLILWYMGLHSAYRIYFYAKTVKGILYRRALAYFAVGVSFIILSTIVLQLVTTLSARLDRLSLAPLLLVIYLLLILISVGYIIVAVGANRLKRLEEV